MTTLTFNAPIHLRAASGKQRRFEILAYSGGTLNVTGFRLPVVVDLGGVTAPDSIPILADHENSISATIGQTDSVENTGRALVMSGPVTVHPPIEGAPLTPAQQVIARADHKWRASIGVLVTEQEEISDGSRVSVNHREFVGPIIVARRSELTETSVLASGADPTTSVNLAARAATGATSMSFEEWATEKGFDIQALSPAAIEFLTMLYDSETNPHDPNSEPVPAVPAAAAAMIDLRATRSAEHQRIARIETLAVNRPLIASAAIIGGWTPEKTELEIMKSDQRTTSPNNLRHSTGGPDNTQVLCASFAMNCGGSQAFLAGSYGDDVIDCASRSEHRGATLFNVMQHVLQAAGMSAPSNKISDSYIHAAFQASRKLEASGLSTVSLPGILSNSSNKLLLEGYGMVKQTWKEFCAIGNLQDLKAAKRYRLTPKGDFEEVGPGGHIKHMALNTEDAYTIQGKTYARMVSLSRTDIINDDLSAFESIPKVLGRMAAIKLEKLIYTTLLGNANSFFHADNDNYLSGAGSALGIDALTAAEKLFLNQVDANGDPVMITPELLLVPTSLSVTANQLTRDLQVVSVGVGSSAAVAPAGNPHAGRFTPVVSPWLENANLSGYSSLGWYLLARPQGSSGLLEVGFLNGRQTPSIENGELDFSQLGIALRGYHDIAVAQQDPKYGVLNAGS